MNADKKNRAGEARAGIHRGGQAALSSPLCALCVLCGEIDARGPGRARTARRHLRSSAFICGPETWSSRSRLPPFCYNILRAAAPCPTASCLRHCSEATYINAMPADLFDDPPRKGQAGYSAKDIEVLEG